MNTKYLLAPILIITLIMVNPFSQAMAYFSQAGNDTIPEQMKKVDETKRESDEFSEMERELEELDEASKESDTTKIRIGKMKIEVVEDGDDITINKDSEWEDDDEDWKDWGWDDDDSWTFHKRKRNKGFDPHWAGFSMGLNNYITADGSTTLPVEWQLLEVNTNNSFEVNLNFAEKGINLIKQRVGLVTGVGLKWNNYKFRNSNVVLNADSTALRISEDPTLKGKMSKLTTWYLIVPVLIEIQIPAGDEELYINAGVEGGLKISSHTKIKTDDKEKYKDKSDFFISSIDYRLTARAGYGDFGIYASYGMMPLFEKDKATELYPVAVGVTLNF